MRILFAHSNADLYGSSRSLLRLTSRLARDGHSMRVVLPYDGLLRDELTRAGVIVDVCPRLPVIERQTVSSPSTLAAWFAGTSASVATMRATVRDFAPDIVHTNTSVMPTPAIVARREGVPHVWHIREFYTEFPLLWRLYRRYIMRFATQIICVSHSVARQFGMAEPGRVNVLHNALPREEFDVVDAGRTNAFRAAYGFGAAPLIGVVGRLKLKRKGQETFIEACALVRDRHPMARFAIIGSAYEGNKGHREELERLALELGLGERLVFTGDVTDIQAAYGALDIAVLPSQMPEPFGNVVVEAMAMGKPVIATNTGGPAEQVADGVTGVLVQVGKPEEMAMAINRLLEDPSLSRAMGAAGRQRYLDHFEFEPFYRQLLDIYRRALDSAAKL